MLRMSMDTCTSLSHGEGVPKERGTLGLVESLLLGILMKSRFDPGLGTEDWAKGRTKMCSGLIRSFWTPEGARYTTSLLSRVGFSSF